MKIIQFDATSEQHQRAAYGLIEAFRLESDEYKDIQFDYRAIFQMGAHPDALAIFALDSAGLPAGCFCGTLARLPFAPHIVGARDAILYVLPKYRGSTAALKLVKTFETWAKNRGASRIYLSQSTNIEPEKTALLYEKLGYKQVGALTCKEV